jgi:hypothetical protein
VVELQAEGGDELGVICGADVIGGHAAAGQEATEVDGGSLDGGTAPTGEFDLGDLLAAAFGSLGDRLGLQDAVIEGGGPAGEVVAVDVERVVRRSVHARPCAGGQRVPAGAGVGRRLRQHAAACPCARLLDLVEGREQALCRVVGDQILAQAIRGEEDRAVGPWLWTGSVHRDGSSQDCR